MRTMTTPTLIKSIPKSGFDFEKKEKNDQIIFKSRIFVTRWIRQTQMTVDDFMTWNKEEYNLSNPLRVRLD